MSLFLHKIMRTIKRLRKLPKFWKIAAIAPIFKNGDKRLVENYRPVSLQNICSGIFEKSIESILPAILEMLDKAATWLRKKAICNHEHVILPEKDTRGN